jgi:hypothetical protein
MADENVVQLPTLLERLADKLRAYLKRDTTNRNEWIEIQEGICLTLAEARGQFPADIEFGQWCDDNGFGQSVLRHETRAAAIAMGRNPEVLRSCLGATERRSLLTIYRKEFCGFITVSKPPTRRKPKLDLTPSPAMQRALNAYDELAAKEEPITAKAIRDRAQVSDTPVRRVFALKSEEAKLDPLTPAEMRATMQKRYELAVRKARLEIREELKEEVYRELDGLVRRVKERSDRADRVLQNFKGVMSKDAFRKIRACLHPDHNSFKFAAEALQTFSELESVLVKPDDPIYRGPPLPTTAAELMARRRHR